MSLTKEDVFKLSSQFLDLMSSITDTSEIYCGIYKSNDDTSRYKLEKQIKNVAKAKSVDKSMASLIIYRGTHNSFKTNGTHATAIIHEQENLKYVVITILVVVIISCLLILMNHSNN